MKNTFIVLFLLQSFLSFSQSKWNFIYGRNFTKFGTTTKVTWVQSPNFKETNEFLSGNSYLGAGLNLGSRKVEFELAAGLSFYKYTKRERIVEERFVQFPAPLVGGYYSTSDSIASNSSLLLVAPILRISANYKISQKYISRIFLSNVATIGFLGGFSVDRKIGERAFLGLNVYRQTPLNNSDLTLDYGVGLQFGCRLLTKSEKQAYMEAKKSRKQKESEIEQSIRENNELQKNKREKKKKSTPTIL